MVPNFHLIHHLINLNDLKFPVLPNQIRKNKIEMTHFLLMMLVVLQGDRPSSTLPGRGQNESTLPEGDCGPCDSAAPLLGIHPLGTPPQEQDDLLHL